MYDKVIKEVQALPDGPQIGAFFDFDGTIIYGYSATTYLREQIKRGDIGVKEFLELLNTMAAFGMGNMGFSAMMAMTSQFLNGIDEQSYIELGERLYNKHIAKLIYPESRALIEAHLKKGHTVALISAATPYQVTAAAEDLGMQHIKCTQLEVVDGKFTGNVVKPTCYGMGKVDAAQQLIAEFSLDVEQSFFYSDSDEDIQLLEYVGNPRPLNPNSRLRRIAKGRGWPVQDFTSRGKVGLRDYARTIATQASMVTSFLAGLPIYALTGSMSKTRNFSTSLFADTACAITGLELDVSGEEHVWAHRPCVFVFNHQSQADTLILPALLRRDLAGVGKKEIGDVPILGWVMKFGGTVLIDRNNSASAVEAMQPLVDVLNKEGRSVCIAPEGTRSTSTNLGRFKKGAFHLAAQAGVPVVPIVIHNAIDVAPKSEFVLRPATVKVTVLPAVDTSDWKAETMEQHMHEVRDMFLVELDQMHLQRPDLKLVKKPKVSKSNSVKKNASVKKPSKRASARKSLVSSVVNKAPAVLRAVARAAENTKTPTAKKAPEAKTAPAANKKAPAANTKAPAARKKKPVRRTTQVVTANKVAVSKKVSRKARRAKTATPKVSARQVNDSITPVVAAKPKVVKAPAAKKKAPAAKKKSTVKKKAPAIRKKTATRAKSGKPLKRSARSSN